MLDVPVSSGNHRSERAGTALFATSATYNPNLDVHACTSVVLGACWIYLLAQVNTALSGPVRHFRPTTSAIVGMLANSIGAWPYSNGSYRSQCPTWRISTYQELSRARART